MQKNSTRFLVAVFLGSIAITINAMPPYPPEEPFYAKPLTAGHFYGSEYAKTPVAKPSGDTPKDPTEYARTPDVVRPRSVTSKDVSNPYAMASEVHGGSGFSEHGKETPKIECTVPSSESRSEKKEKLRTKEKEKSRGRRVSLALGTLRSGILKASSSRPPKQPSPLTAQALHDARIRHVPITEGGIMAKPKPALKEPEKEEEECAYGNAPKDFTRQLKWLLREEDPSIPECMRFLSQGADPCTKGESGNTMLHVLAACGNTGGLEYLWKIVPDLNITDGAGKTALMHAMEKQQWNAVQFLLEKGATHPDELTAYFALTQKQPGLAKILFETHSSQIHSVDKGGKTLLHTAILHLDDKDALKIAMVLCEKYKADPNQGDNFGKKPIEYAVAKKHKRVVDYLLPKTNDVDCTALSAKTTDATIRRLLLQKEKEKTTI